MCKQLGISHAAYYKWLHRTIPEQESENTKLAELIKEYDERFGHILGYRRMTSWINHFNHTSYSKNRVHRIMKKMGIHSIIRKKKKKYQSSRPETTAENKLKREFNATKPNEKWATDVTEFKVPETGRKLYLSAVSYTHLDVYKRQVRRALPGVYGGMIWIYGEFKTGPSTLPSCLPAQKKKPHKRLLGENFF